MRYVGQRVVACLGGLGIGEGAACECCPDHSHVPTKWEPRKREPGIVKAVYYGGATVVHLDTGRDVACGPDETEAMNETEITMSETTVQGLHVQQAMNEIKLELARHGGITKDRNAPVGGGYAFRGIDDIYNVLCGLTAQHRMNMYPSVVGKPDVAYQTTVKNGRQGEKIEQLQTHVHLLMSVKLVSAVDGSSEIITTAGEAIDHGDKATNKAMSAAMKYACIMAFQIPVHGENVDIEAHDVQVAPPAPAEPQRRTREQVMSQLPVAGEVVPPPVVKERKKRGPKLENGTPMEAQEDPPRPDTDAVDIQHANLQRTLDANAAARATEPAPAEPALNPDDFAALDTSDGAIDWQLAAMAKADNATTFADLFETAKDADPRAEPGRGVVFDHVFARTTVLIGQAPTLDALKEAKGLIKALGSAQTLLEAYNARYSTFRSTT